MKCRTNIQNIYQKVTLFLHKIKFRTLNRNLRHSSLDKNVMHMHEQKLDF